MKKSKTVAFGSFFFLVAMQMLFSVKELSATETLGSPLATCTPETVGSVQKVANELAVLYSPEQKPTTQELANARGKLFGQLVSYGPCAVPVLDNDFWKSDVSPKRIIALYGFGHILKKDAQGYLLEGIKDPSRDVRIIAVLLLSTHKDDKTEDAMIEMLAKETDESIKRLAMAAILDFKNDKAVAAVTSYQNDKDPKVQQAAKALLARFAQQKAQPQKRAV